MYVCMYVVRFLVDSAGSHPRTLPEALLYHGQMYWDSFTVLMLFLSSLESPVAQW